jgi:hypothetical protein
MVLGRADLVFEMFFPKSENNFEAGFSGFRRSRKITSFGPPKAGGLK